MFTEKNGLCVLSADNIYYLNYSSEMHFSVSWYTLYKQHIKYTFIYQRNLVH